ncbi:MAG TPA: 4-phosphopantoate--beta-alanine ligase [Candidatus Methanoculleus thermohydrogenotrophicum]|jgi:4-phosphopantoate--beta-alanine ligase|nr:4-phosphopantoate--beta-alanine ligase [Candidatus Methanoculleus thermohydrogenotrophicum]NLM82118.1 phosphopantothenate/pantothenate synthetase [Candidatus Methanoculleus thermohydrogenotrophicum]HOB18352.1 4-phosphopantoate--beta-alanine ligase [Candidatus Methanoculleus thermohydrogenotrophicum]HPZ37839.1 4-phosphopantoate--beta-alanine ligase [Candidatus Methanoculleus thermohydrogenotrophicum]HQC91065.1 4-phosphopantoate--beta-alanine ligase [Candidatus Methanoculleus thermohydrogenotr
MIPKDHPRYRSLVARERLARCAREGVVAFEGLAAHGRGEAFDYLIGERTIESAALAARTAAAMLLSARHAVISVNGNTAALAAREVAALQQASGADVEVNLFHRTDERIALITRLLEKHGVRVLSGTPERLVPLAHDRGLCLREGIGGADVVLVPLEDGDRCEALRAMGKAVITIDLNPLSRTARTATLTIVDELTRALPGITAACGALTPDERERLIRSLDNTYLLRAAIDEMRERLVHALE